MKICITATAGDLNAQVDPRFGRCQYFDKEEKIKIYREKVKDKDEDMHNCNSRRPECAGRPEVRKVPVLCDRRFGDNGV
jgi:hypothetical protein